MHVAIRFVKSLARWSCALLCLAAISSAQAEEPRTPRPEIARFGDIADARFNTLPDIAGAAVAAGRAGEPVWFKGYGLRDITKKTPMDAERTSFHVASVTKLVTAIAIMQLVDRGRLSLDDEVNARLSVPLLKPVAGKVVRIRHLLTHTAGLDIDFLDLAVTEPRRVIPLVTYLKAHLPAQIAPPGDRTAYSNHGYGILGAVIETACHCSYVDYVQREIFDRAALTQSAINTHPQAAGLARATGYFYREQTIAEPELFEHMSAAGAALMSVPDVVKLVLALDAGTLMSPAAAAQLTTVQFTHQPQLGGGYGFGFWRAPGYDTPVWLIGGDVPGQSTRVLYLPEHKFATAIAVNRKDSIPAERLLREFLKTYETRAATLAATLGPAAVAGEYRYAAYPHGNFLKIAALVGPTLKVEPEATGLRIKGPADDGAALWRQVAPSVFQRDGTNERIAFRTDHAGKQWAYLDTFEAGPLAFEVIPPIASPTIWLLLFAAPLVVAVIVVIAGTLRLFVRRSPASPGSPLGPASLLANATVFAAASLFVWSFHELAIARDDRFAYEPLPLTMTIALALPYLGLPFSMWFAIQTISAWRNTGIATRVVAVVVLLALCAHWVSTWEWRLFEQAPLTILRP